MKKIMFVMFAASVMWLASCSNPSDSVNNWESTVSNGGSTQVNQGNENPTRNQTQRNDEFPCDMGCDFNLQDYEYYINNTKIDIPFSATPNEEFTWSDNVLNDLCVRLTFIKNNTQLIVKKAINGQTNNSYTIKTVTKSNRTVRVELERIN